MRRVNTIICRNASLRGAAICQVRGSRNDCVRGKAAREPVASPLCCGRALIVHRRRILSRRHPAYAMPCRAVLPMHTPPPDSGETESLYVLVLPPSRKAPRLGHLCHSSEAHGGSFSFVIANHTNVSQSVAVESTDLMVSINQNSADATHSRTFASRVDSSGMAGFAAPTVGSICRTAQLK